MKITLFSGDTILSYIECEIESSFVELVFTGRPYKGPGSGYSLFHRRITTTLGYIIETEVKDEPPTPSDKTAFGSMLPNERQA